MNAPRPKLDVDTTRERLVALGCGYAADQLDHVLREAVRTEVPALAFLDSLLQAELSGREARRVKTSLRSKRLRFRTKRPTSIGTSSRCKATAKTPFAMLFNAE